MSKLSFSLLAAVFPRQVIAPPILPLFFPFSSPDTCPIPTCNLARFLQEKDRRGLSSNTFSPSGPIMKKAHAGEAESVFGLAIPRVLRLETFPPCNVFAAQNFSLFLRCQSLFHSRLTISRAVANMPHGRGMARVGHSPPAKRETYFPKVQFVKFAFHDSRALNSDFTAPKREIGISQLESGNLFKIPPGTVWNVDGFTVSKRASFLETCTCEYMFTCRAEHINSCSYVQLCMCEDSYMHSCSYVQPSIFGARFGEV